MTRPDAMLHVHETACAVLGTDNCFASVQPSDPAPTFPSVVFQAVGQDTLTTLTEGAHQIATAIRFDVRDRMQKETERLSDEIVAALRAGSRLIWLGTLIDDFDDELSIYRRIRTVTVR